MDKTFVIYDGSSTGYVGNGAKLYDIRNDLVDYTYIDENTYMIDSLQAQVHSFNKYQKTHAGGATGINIWDVFRLSSLDGTLIGSGRITQQPQVTNNQAYLRGEGWIGIFKDREINRSFSNVTGKDIITSILSTEYSPYTFNTAGMNTPSNTFTSKTFQKQYAYDVIKWVCDNSYGPNNKNFNIRVYEDPANLGTIKVDFAERESWTKILDIQPQYIKPDGFKLVQRGDLNANYIKIYGATTNFNKCPIDSDYWTEGLGLGMISLSNANGGSTFAPPAPMVGIISYYMSPQANKTLVEIAFYLTNANAYDATKTPNQLFTNGSGYKVDLSRNQRIRFYVRVSSSIYNSMAAGGRLGYIGVQFVSDLGASNAMYAYLFSNPDSFINPSFFMQGSPDIWFTVDLAVKDITMPTAAFLQIIDFAMVYPAGNSQTGGNFYIDGIYFYEATGQAAGSYTAGVTPQIDKVIQDQTIDSDWLATQIATAYYKSQFNQYVGSVSLTRELSSLYAGGNVGVYYPPAGVNVSSLPIQRVTWKPYDTQVDLGYMKISEEIIADIRSDLRRK